MKTKVLKRFRIDCEISETDNNLNKHQFWQLERLETKEIPGEIERLEGKEKVCLDTDEKTADIESPEEDDVDYADFKQPLASIHPDVARSYAAVSEPLQNADDLDCTDMAVTRPTPQTKSFKHADVRIKSSQRRNDRRQKDAHRLSSQPGKHQYKPTEAETKQRGLRHHGKYMKYSHNTSEGIPEKADAQKYGKPSKKKLHTDGETQPKDISPDTEETTVTMFDVLGNLVGIVSYLFDIGSDIWVALAYYAGGHWWWFALTLSFVIVPSITITVFSLVWYIQDHRLQKRHNVEVSPLRWMSRFFFLFFQIAPILRYIDSIIYGLRSRRAKEHIYRRHHWYDRMLHEDTDTTLLRLIECFMEAAPQLVLQLYIIATLGLQTPWYMGAAQCISCTTSLLSLSWSLAAYHKALRFSLKDEANMTWTGFAMYFMWRLFTIAARVFALALFASAVHGGFLAMAMALHFLIMIIWVLIKQTNFCKSRIQEVFFNVVVSLVYIFTFLNVIDGHTRLRYIIYYSILYAENMAMIAVWYSRRSTDGAWYNIPALFVVLLGFWIGILFQLIYYKFFHPNNYLQTPQPPQIKTCLTWKECINRDGTESETDTEEVKVCVRNEVKPLPQQPRSSRMENLPAKLEIVQESDKEVPATHKRHSSNCHGDELTKRTEKERRPKSYPAHNKNEAGIKSRPSDKYGRTKHTASAKPPSKSKKMSKPHADHRNVPLRKSQNGSQLKPCSNQRVKSYPERKPHTKRPAKPRGETQQESASLLTKVQDGKNDPMSEIAFARTKDWVQSTNQTSNDPQTRRLSTGDLETVIY